MLRKLMKYEFKATGRCLLPLYAALLIFAFIVRILFKGSLINTINKDFGTFGDIANVLSIFLYGFTMAAVFVATFFIIVQRFYKNILGDEGYLMNTLPVKPYLNIANKILVSAIWTIISCFVAFISVLILFATFDSFTDILFPTLIEVLKNITSEFSDMYPCLIFFEICIIGLIQLIESITMIYASISIGHLFSKAKILSSFAAYIGLSIVSSIINSILLFICSNFHPQTENMSLYLLLYILLETAYFAVYFFITNYIITHKLNLE